MPGEAGSTLKYHTGDVVMTAALEGTAIDIKLCGAYLVVVFANRIDILHVRDAGVVHSIVVEHVLKAGL